jgi:putative FmdB family regulatory protein
LKFKISCLYFQEVATGKTIQGGVPDWPLNHFLSFGPGGRNAGRAPMPVYEFYCSDCHTVFNFLSRRMNLDKRPACPRCGRPELERQVSRFSISRNRSDPPPDGFPDLDDERVANAMLSMAGDMEGLDENDPRVMGRILRRMSETTGLTLGSGFEEALRRLEAGEDPDKIEEEMGDLLTEGNPLSRESIRTLRRRCTPPEHDETLHVL